jgi:hypothetical protein
MASPLRVCRASTIISGDLRLMREHFESHILNVFDVYAYASDGKSSLRRCSGQACGTMSREDPLTPVTKIVKFRVKENLNQ